MGLAKRNQEERASDRGWHTIRRAGIKGIDTSIDVDKCENIPQVVGVYNQLSWSIAKAEPKVYAETDDGVLIEVKQSIWPKWIKKPNGLQTRFAFMEQLAQQGLYYGNIFLLPARNEWFVIHFDDVTVEEPVQYGGKAKYFVGGKNVTNKIKHIAFNARPGETLGRSPIQQAKDHVLGALAAGTYRRDLYENGMNLAGVIEGNAKSKEEAQQTVESFYAAHKAGAEGGTPIGYLSNATWKTVTLTPSDAEYVESQRWDAQIWATLLGVPLFMLDASAGSWAGTGLQVMNTAYLQFTLSPFAGRIEEAISELLGEGLVFRFDLQSVLISSPRDEADMDVKLTGGPVLTPNEIRRKRGYPDVEGGDELRMPMWVKTMDDVDGQSEVDIADKQAGINNQENI